MILVNLTTALTNTLRAKDLKGKGFLQPLRVHMPVTGFYAYPDLIVTRTEPVLGSYDTLLNPTVIIEILSPTTQDYDRGSEFSSYRSIPSLEEYWTIAQDRVHVERRTIVNHHWTLTSTFNSRRSSPGPIWHSRSPNCIGISASPANPASAN